MHYDWEQPADGMLRTRLPFLDVTVGAALGGSGLLLIDCGTTLVEAAGVDGDMRELTAVGDDADPVAWPTALDRLLELGGDDAVYVPGHGATVDAAFVRRQRDRLRTRH